MATQQEFSPFGIAKHPWITKADTKFNADGLFHVELVLSGEVAQRFKAKIKAASEKAFEEYFQDDSPRGGAKITPGDRKKWTVYYPFEDVSDPQTGDETGDVSFDFKQNAKIKLRDQTTKDVTIMLVDSNAEDMPETSIVGNGSVVRIMYSMRRIPMTSTKQVGIRLDFSGVQVKELKGSTGGRVGFGKVEGGFTQQQSGDEGGAEGGDEGEY